jgi:glutathione S-transferase
MDSPSYFYDIKSSTREHTSNMGCNTGGCTSKEEFPTSAKAHLAGAATGHLAKLEGFCKGPYMCGETPQSGDFQLFEMLDQHASICAHVGEANILDTYPKLKALHAHMKVALHECFMNVPVVS